ncbi:ABC transporter ATP-binding protein [Peribacillus sp. SCS-26]|uniref:ABC transporter ATP-binding protein n=1 Tax=Paraperibacillus marinus TaxID=3115295 RepID=UPI00390626D2
MCFDALELRGVSFAYPNGRVSALRPLNGVDFKVSAGEFVSIIGPSGSGKSTIFRLISGLEQPDEGTILLNGSFKANRLGCVGYMPQKDLLMPWRTVLDNAALPLEIKGDGKEEAREKVLKLLGEFGLKDVEGHFPAELSGGMKQRVSFLRTILSGSDLLLLDEPFSALDAITRLGMQEWLLRQWSKWQKTILFITHDVDEAMYLSDRILVLPKDGGPIQEVRVPLKRPRALRDLSGRYAAALKEQLLSALRPGTGV